MQKIEMSVGEIIDRWIILRIKATRITDKAKLLNIMIELESLNNVAKIYHYQDVHGTRLDKSRQKQVRELSEALEAINMLLWNIEDEIRVCERKKCFDQSFIDLARAVYKNNDKRAILKREINFLIGSGFIEEKSYEEYDE